MARNRGARPVSDKRARSMYSVRLPSSVWWQGISWNLPPFSWSRTHSRRCWWKMSPTFRPQAAETRANVNTMTPIRARSRSPSTSSVLIERSSSPASSAVSTGVLPLPSRSQRVQRSERSHSAERRRSRTPEPRKSTQQRAQRELRQNKPVERRAQERERASPGKAVEAGRALKGNEHLEQRVVEKHSEIQQSRTRLGSEERQKLHRAFDVQKARVSRASFDHHVGKRIPRHVRLFRIPSTVFVFFPY